MGKHHLGAIQSCLLLGAGPIRAGYTGPSPVKLDHFQGCWCHSVSWQPSPGFDHPQGSFFSLYWIWIVQFVSIASCHVPVHLCKEPFSIFPTPLVIGSGSSSKLSPWAAVPQAVQTQLSQLVVHLVYHTAASHLSCFAVSVPVLSWEDQSWTIAPDAVSQMPGRGKLPSPSICRQCFS